MKKGLIGILAIASGVVLIAPKFVGDNIKNQMDVFVENLSSEAGVSAEFINIERSWYATDGTLKVTLDLAEIVKDPSLMDSDMPPVLLTYDVAVDHSPMTLAGMNLATAEATLENEQLRELLTWAPNVSFYRINAEMGLTGRISFEDKMEAFTFTSEEVSIEVSEYAGSGHMNAKDYDYQGMFGAITVSDEADSDAVVSLNKLNLDVEGQLNDDFMFSTTEMLDSTVSIALDNLQIKQETDVINIGDVLVSADTDLSKQDVTDITFQYAVGTIESPEFKANNLELIIAFENLDTAFLEELSAQAQEMSDSMYSSPDMLAGLQLYVEENLLTVIQKQPGIRITSLKGELPWGAFEGKLATNLNHVDALPAPLVEIEPTFWLSNLVLTADMSMDESLALELAKQQLKRELMKIPQVAESSEEEIEQLLNRQAPMMIEQFAAQGFLVKEGEKYKSSLSFEDMMVELNGQQMPLPF